MKGMTGGQFREAVRDALSLCLRAEPSDRVAVAQQVQKNWRKINSEEFPVDFRADIETILVADVQSVDDADVVFERIGFLAHELRV